jgi:hypothetical protein
MLTSDEKKFIDYWTQNRLKEKSVFSQIRGGLVIGAGIGVAIFISYATGWYTRAVMVANSRSTPIILIIAVITIAVFCSVFHKKHRWDMNESYFKSLLNKKEKENLKYNMQHPVENSSQLGEK